MPAQIYVLLTWTTLRRTDVIDDIVAAFLRRFPPPVARRFGADVLALGAVSDHVHLLLFLPLVVDIPRLVPALKGASARVGNRDRVGSRGPLRWAQGYDLRSIGVRGVQRVTSYVAHQAEQHARTPQTSVPG